MPDDQNTTQNPISEESPIPASYQEPMADIPVIERGLPSLSLTRY